MTAGDLAYVLLAINPFGGLWLAVPFAVFKLDYPAWLCVMTSVPLSYVQVVVVDLGWNTLNRWPRWQALIQKKRSANLEKLLASNGSFLPTMLSAPMVGPWLVMALMRYAQIPQRKVALPIGLGMTAMAVFVTALCFVAPEIVK